jgi:hypothetical protein
MKIVRLFVAFVVVCFALSPSVRGVVPPPPGGYPNFTTAAGDHALQALTLGIGNTAVGTFSLFSVTTGSFNTAVGAGSLDLNTADSNTATGAAALLFNTSGTENTANGTAALELNETGSNNTATGAFALFNNITGDNNTALGFDALQANITGTGNTALGGGALGTNTGSNNTAVGFLAGLAVSTASHVICIGTSGNDVSNSCFTGNIFGSTSSNGVAVLVNSNGRLGTMTSSARFKDEIKPIDKASEALFALKPVSFRYKKEIDPAGTSQFGLVAEDVEKVNPDLVVRDKEGKPYTVRYDRVNAMLLNEFLKEHKKTEKLEAAVASLIATVKEQGAQIQKVNAQLELNKAAPQTVVNRQ